MHSGKNAQSPEVGVELRALRTPWTVTPYAPFPDTSGRYAEVADDQRAFLVRVVEQRIEGVWPLPADRRKPGHGLFLVEHIEPMRGALVADLGTGPMAFLALRAAALGARHVVGVDIDPGVVASARGCVAATPHQEVVRVESSDLWSRIPVGAYQHAIIHPPMLPWSAASGDAAAHHDAGADGRLVLDRAIRESAARLVAGGTLLIGQFEFLGVDRSFGPSESTFDVLQDSGFAARVCAAYVVEATPLILARLELIEARYPDHAFLRAGNKLMHRFVVVAGTRREDGAGASRARSMQSPTSPDPEGERR